MFNFERLILFFYITSLIQCGSVHVSNHLSKTSTGTKTGSILPINYGWAVQPAEKFSKNVLYIS